MGWSTWPIKIEAQSLDHSIGSIFQLIKSPPWTAIRLFRRRTIGHRRNLEVTSRSSQGRCVICGGVGISDAYYCKECTQQEKDRDGCPKIVNLGSAKTDLFYERKKYGFKKRRYVIAIDDLMVISFCDAFDGGFLPVVLLLSIVVVLSRRIDFKWQEDLYSGWVCPTKEDTGD
ncbi:hypothetical protein Vadar_022974 [Vaccinium darrowii]|uniref:Uncharacterized protein n=1 Tax=Vaccinium darrowii TaxID=229202 RepID=A0ACB7ZFS0_9ERIC|nr:hypothetical protein Vadar_022974 [Vaccinium darrowii]